MDPVQEVLSARSAAVQNAFQVKVFKGAIEDQGKIAMKLIESAVSVPTNRGSYPTGQALDVVA